MILILYLKHSKFLIRFQFLQAKFCSNHNYFCYHGRATNIASLVQIASKLKRNSDYLRNRQQSGKCRVIPLKHFAGTATFLLTNPANVRSRQFAEFPKLGTNFWLVLRGKTNGNSRGTFVWELVLPAALKQFSAKNSTL